MRLERRKIVALKPVLDGLAASFERATGVDDPVRFLSRYRRLADREIAAFLASGLAFGRVRSVMQSVGAVLTAMGDHPATFVEEFSASRDATALLPLVHRWTRGEDLVALMVVLRQMLREAGSIERFFAEGAEPGAADVTDLLERFSARACEIDVTEAYGRRRPRPGVGYFFTRPSRGGACKRLNLFLRWMVRRDAVDPGGWSMISPAQLVVPLDVHIIRVGRCLGLTRYTSPGWKMAADITASLRALDPADPIKYDFALCHLGMLGQCTFNRSVPASECPLRGFCRPVGRRPRASH